MSWLWRNDTSPASFEKALSRLSGQISTAQVGLDKTRARTRRVKVLWTLYTIGGYVLSLVVLVLVVGPQDWYWPHYAGLAGAPALIYGVRKLITAIGGWSAGRQQAHLDRLTKQREDKIQDLKKATRFDSTQELLQKYGGSPPQKEKKGDNEGSNKSKKKPQGPQIPPGQRTGMMPPPTANIPGRPMPQSMQRPETPSAPPHNRLQEHSPQLMQSPIMPDEPEFAPNAFSQPPPAQMSYAPEHNWYDRILDVLLGEDETLAKNRIVLLCQNCKLVNGQAPPGVKTAEQLGKWRCHSCGAWNGVDTATAAIVQEIAQESSPASEEWQTVGKAADVESEESEEEPKATIKLDDQREPSGRDTGSDSKTVSKRKTRSAGKAEAKGL